MEAPDGRESAGPFDTAEEAGRWRERSEGYEDWKPVPLYRLPDHGFQIGDLVLKHGGDYQADGVVKGIIEDNGKIRYVVRHDANINGHFYHIYSPNQLQLATRLIADGPITTNQIIEGEAQP
jgi:hypothetical protein